MICMCFRKQYCYKSWSSSLGTKLSCTSFAIILWEHSTIHAKPSYDISPAIENLLVYKRLRHIQFKLHCMTHSFLLGLKITFHSLVVILQSVYYRSRPLLPVCFTSDISHLLYTNWFDKDCDVQLARRWVRKCTLTSLYFKTYWRL